MYDEGVKDERRIIMEYVKLNNGVEMPILGFGVYQIPKEETKQCVLDALKVGYRAIDTAQSYFNEREVGEKQKTHHAPIVSPVPDLSLYDVIYIGSPVYWGYMPKELVTALKDIDFTGKTIRPFVTHEGSGLARIPSQIQEICYGAHVSRGLAIKGSQVKSAKEQVAAWI